MSSQPPKPLHFLHHQPARGGARGSGMDSDARAHASRQGYLRASKAKNLKFVSYRAEKDNETKERLQRLVKYRADASPTSGSVPGARGWDPFDSMAVQNLTDEESSMLHYAFTTSWAAFGDFAEGKRKFARGWMTRTMESAEAFHSQTLAATSHYLVSNPDTTRLRELTTLTLNAKIKAIKALQELISQRNAPISRIASETTLIAIFVLAVHDNFNLSKDPEPHGLSPMATHRHLHIYGQMDFSDEHMNALYDLVEMHGGVEKIDQHVLGYVLPLADLLWNARKGRAPRYPCHRQYQRIRDTRVWLPDQQALDMLDVQASSFSNSGGQLAYILGLDPTSADVLPVLGELTVAMDHYIRGGPGAPQNLDCLVNNCDWAAHRAMTQLSYVGISNHKGDADANLREICRLSVLIYTDIMIFPMPSHAKIKYRHAEVMLPILQSLRRGISDDRPVVQHFLAWSCMLAAIASRFTELAATYTDLVAFFCVSHLVDESVANGVFNTFLWLDPILNPAAHALWLDASALLGAPANEPLEPVVPGTD